MPKKQFERYDSIKYRHKVTAQKKHAKKGKVAAEYEQKTKSTANINFMKREYRRKKWYDEIYTSEDDAKNRYFFLKGEFGPKNVQAIFNGFGYIIRYRALDVVSSNLSMH